MGTIYLFRAMKECDGSPVCGDTRRCLGVRTIEPDPDILQDGAGMVHPAKGGLSVAPLKPENLPQSKRPKKFGGLGKDPVFKIAIEEIMAPIVFRVDQEDETHGHIEPLMTMAAADFQCKLCRTKPNWELA